MPAAKEQAQAALLEIEERFATSLAIEQAEEPGEDETIWALVAGARAKNWSRVLVRDHLSPDAQLALFQTCSDGKDLVLGAAERAAMKVTLAMQQPDLPLSMTSVQAVKSALLTRGNLRTSLQLSASAPSLLSTVQVLLGDSTTWVDTLHLGLAPGKRLPTTTLAAFATSCPNLRALAINAAPEAVPSPDLFPRLRELNIHIQPRSVEHILRTTAPYVKQLTSLTVVGRGLEPEQASTHLPLLLNPANTATNLRTLSTFAMLNDALLGVLLQCAPALTHLKVHTLQLTCNLHAACKATWQELEVVRMLHVSSLAHLPLTAGMQLIMPKVVRCDTITAAGAAAVAAAVARFKQVVVPSAHQSTNLAPTEGMPAAVQPHALKAGVTLLRACTTPATGQDLALSGWSMTAAVVHELHQGLPSWQVLVLSGSVWFSGPAGTPFATLLTQLPISFREVRCEPPASYRGPHFPSLTLTGPQLESICLSAPVDRTPEAPLLIRLTSFDHRQIDGQAVEAIRCKMKQRGVFHVEISR